tara:strand:- start:2840 stop:3139 length:300 start_codon:yes stop_codon:yes gene_type:complete
MVQVRIDELTESPWDTSGIADTEVVVMVTHGDHALTLCRKDLADLTQQGGRVVVLLPKSMGILVGVHAGSTGVEEVTEVNEVGDILRLALQNTQEPIDS